MVTNVTSLLKTVKSVEDEATRGTRALESTIEAIGQEIKVCSHHLLFTFTCIYNYLYTLKSVVLISNTRFW